MARTKLFDWCQFCIESSVSEWKKKYGVRVRLSQTPMKFSNPIFDENKSACGQTSKLQSTAQYAQI